MNEACRNAEDEDSSSSEEDIEAEPEKKRSLSDALPTVRFGNLRKTSISEDSEGIMPLNEMTDLLPAQPRGSLTRGYGLGLDGADEEWSEMPPVTRGRSDRVHGGSIMDRLG